jgi:molybdopterin-guanine dinucleotide biosynthesis protein A
MSAEKSPEKSLIPLNPSEIKKFERGAIVLCGGQSSRMGFPKAMLPFGPERMVQRVVRLLDSVAATRVVVAAEGQELPDLPRDVIIARDQRPARGPLEGIAAGLRAMPTTIECAFVTSCDSPLLRPEFALRLFELCEPEFEIVVPKDERFHHPLAAVYRTGQLQRIESLLQADQLRPIFLFQHAAVREIETHALRSVDPELDSLRNTNTPTEYAKCLARAGFQMDETMRRRIGL